MVAQAENMPAAHHLMAAPALRLISMAAAVAAVAAETQHLQMPKPEVEEEAGHMPGAAVWVARQTILARMAQKERMGPEKDGFQFRSTMDMMAVVAAAVPVAGQ